ncbi:hypothetical protein MSIMFI_05474 [Mycobacterium simulans]|nr:hypothetical protein MSIMFI_05474 [Mycobacterium simulans]
MADRQRGGLVAVGAAVFAELVDVFEGAGDHDRGGAVDRGKGGVGVAGEWAHDVLWGGLDGEHGSGGAGLHESTAGADQNRGILEGEHAGQMGGGQFADGVAHQDVGCDAGVGEDGVHGDAVGEQGGLGVGGLGQQPCGGRIRLGENDVTQRDFEVGVKGGGDLVEGVGERVVLGIQLGTHAGVLGPLTGQDEHDLGALMGQMMLGQVRVGPAVAQCLQPDQQLRADILGCWCGDGRAIRVVGAGGSQAVGDIDQIQIGMVDQLLVEPVGVGGQGCRGARRDRPHWQRECAGR